MATKKDRQDPKTPDFEASMAHLQSIIGKLESEKLSLEDSMVAFEEGVKLIRQAQQSLAAAEQKVKLLLEKNGAPVASEFSELQDAE